MSHASNQKVKADQRLNISLGYTVSLRKLGYRRACLNLNHQKSAAAAKARATEKKYTCSKFLKSINNK